MMKNPENDNPGLTPCLKPDCTLWDEGECVSLEKSHTARVNQGEEKKIITLCFP
jgi:hypothetical protein